MISTQSIRKQNISPTTPTTPKKQLNDFEYSLDNQLGSGEFSTVFKGKQISSGRDIAIKVISNSKLIGELEQKMLTAEIDALKILKSPYILEFVHYMYTENNKYIITEYCNQGELLCGANHPEKTIFLIWSYLLSALKEMKNKRIVHRDIKPSNILVHNGIPKLADFGFSISQEKLELQKNKQYGTPLYMAPESMLYEQYSFQSDIWSLGITMFEFIYGQVPFYHPNENQLKKIIQTYVNNPRLNIPDSSYKQLLQGMLDPNPNTRMTVEQLQALIEPFLDCDNQIQSKQHYILQFVERLLNFSRSQSDLSLSLGLVKIILQKFNLNCKDKQIALTLIQQLQNQLNNCLTFEIQQFLNIYDEKLQLQVIRNLILQKLSDSRYHIFRKHLLEICNFITTL